MSQVEKTRCKVERSTGKNRLHCRGSFVMKRSGFVSYNRRCKEEWQQLDTERDRSHGSHAAASSSGDHQIQPEHGLYESSQPGNVQRLVEKFRRLGESTSNNKPCNRNVPAKRLSGSLTEGFAIVRKRSDRKKTRMTEEKWILLTPSLFSPHELDSCSVSLSKPTIPVIHHQNPIRPAIRPKHRDVRLLHALGCEHDVSEIVVPIECITIENPAESHKRLTIGASKDYLRQEKANDEQTYEEIQTVETLDCPDTKNVVPHDKTKEISESISHLRYEEANDKQIYEEIQTVETLDCPDTKNVVPHDKTKEISESISHLRYEEANDKQIYEEIQTVETLDCPDTKNVVLCDKTKEISEDILQKDLVVVNNDAHYEEIEVKPLIEVCYVPSLVIMRKERVYEEIDDESIRNHSEDFNHSDAGNTTGKDAGIADHPSTAAHNFTSDDSIYEEIDLNPPMIVVREPSFSSPQLIRTSKTHGSNKSENLSVTGSQCEDFCSTPSVFEESSSADSIISDLDDYDIVYRSELIGLGFSHCKTCRKLRKKSCECHGVSSKTNGSKKNAEETASVTNDIENVYEEYQFSPAIVSSQGTVLDNVKRKQVASNDITIEGGPYCETGCHERVPSTGATSESSSINSFSSSSYESFSSDDEYVEDASGDHDVLMQRAEEPSRDGGNEEPVTKLDRIIREIIDTERKYIERLKLINDEFRVAVTTWNQEKNYIPADIIRQMFLNIDIIYKLHSGFFLPELEACMKKEIMKKIEDVFIKGADFLKLYAEYSCSFSTAMKLIEQWKIKVPEFSRFILGIQQKPICQSLTLEHHMLEPILRIPRYELLLNKYLEHLPEDSHEREKSLKAVQKVTAAASFCNDFIKSMEKYRKVMDVQQSLWSKVDLMTPSRELIMEGRMKVTQQQCKDEDKHLFLFNDTLLVCKIFPLGITPPYKLTLQLDIDGMQVVDRHKEEIVETFFVISKQGYLEMHPGSMEEKEKWISALNAVITKYMALEKSRKPAVLRNSVKKEKPCSSYSRQKSVPGTQAPIWIKDPQANRCMQCDEKFNAIKRRHHCRACGIVVCGKCSTKEALLAFDNFSQQHRVCDKCFSEISSSTKDGSESEAKVSISLLKSVPHLSRAESKHSRTSTFFILPCDEESPFHSKPKEEQTVTELTSRLEAIIETDTESKEDSQEQVT